MLERISCTCLYWTSKLWVDRQIKVQNRDRRENESLSNLEISISKMKSGCRGTLEHTYEPVDPDKREKTKSERSGQGHKLQPTLDLKVAIMWLTDA